LSSTLLQIDASGKRICFWGAPSDASLPSASPNRQLNATGGNAGNIFIGHGLYENVVAKEKAYHPGFQVVHTDEFDEKYDALFIPASNFVNPTANLEAEYEYFRRTKVSLICFGLGSQFLPGSEIVLTPGTDRFLRLVSERSGSIGVRGAFTAEILWDLGIRNISIIGCPSLLSMTREALQRLDRTRAGLARIGVNYSTNVRFHSLNPDAMAATENSLFRRAMEENSYYILQNETPEVDILHRKISNPREEETEHTRDTLRMVWETFGTPLTYSQFRDYVYDRMLIFFSVSSWVDCMSTMTASVGTRFHGNVAALLAGVRGLFLVHDMRTLELCEFYALPHLVLDRAYSGEEVLECLTSCDYASFIRRLAPVRTEWKLFAERNGLRVVGDVYDVGANRAVDSSGHCEMDPKSRTDDFVGDWLHSIVEDRADDDKD